MAISWVLGSGGIGLAVAQTLSNQGDEVHLLSRRPVEDNFSTYQLADWHWASIQASLKTLPQPDKIIIATGMLWTDEHPPEKRLEDLNESRFLEAFAANTLITAAVIEHLSERMKRNTALKLLTISAKVGSISDNKLGGWYAYRVSKAALNMLVKTTAIEWQRRYPMSAIASYHPGTTDSRLSQPFQVRLPEGQLKTPQDAAACLISVLDKQVTPEQSGRFWHWDGSEIGW
ncbi:SDR family NAD(P)-dependent oxidoreductase [Nitrincola nitratireducens]|uniref:C signal n=1 Tax=Nitrincola nitratireducens TaxID=1229521 RepID=W9V371_9GAMM|nr:SDR family NAD(P)-dependent oxidoreductase [Nitrincola nitratireducens]EXJ10602.1 C signal [Nitrincola nitratireducens]